MNFLIDSTPEAAPASKPTSMLPFRRHSPKIGEEMEEMVEILKIIYHPPFTDFFWVESESIKVNGLEEIVTVIFFWDPWTGLSHLEPQPNGPEFNITNIPVESYQICAPKMSTNEKYPCFSRSQLLGHTHRWCASLIGALIRDYYVFHCLPASSNTMEAWNYMDAKGIC